MTSLPTRCDRCGVAASHVQLMGYTLVDEAFWLCIDCAYGIVRMWLTENEPSIQRFRAIYQVEPEEA